MYLLNAETEIAWELGVTASTIALADLDLLIIDPEGITTYIDAPIDVGRFTAPTELLAGSASYLFTPIYEGLYRIRLVIGTSLSYKILSKVEMYIIDNTSVVRPFSPEIGRPVPYDIAFYLQGFVVPNEMFGSFIATRDVHISSLETGHKASSTTVPLNGDHIFNIYHNLNVVGTVTFAQNDPSGSFSVPDIHLLPSDTLRIFTGGSVDANVRDVSITIVGCSDVSDCSIL